MYNLNEILDDVRSKYYCSSIMSRPTISWTDDFCTGCLGSYNYYNNHIQISRILQDESIPRGVVAYAVHHENIHQDYSEHGTRFQQIEKLFPDSIKMDRQLQRIADKVHESIQYELGYNDFLKGKKRVVYIHLANYSDDYVSAFGSVEYKLCVNAFADVDFKPNRTQDFYVFLVTAYDGTYHIVAWCTDGILLNNRKIEFKKNIGGDDVLYQFQTDYGKLFLLPESCCDYGIPQDGLNADFANNNICLYSVDDPTIQDDLAYINSYCEGYLDIGFNKSQIDTIPKFLDTITINELKNVYTDDVFRKMWISNAIYQRERTNDNLYKRATARMESGLYTAAISDFHDLMKVDGNNPLIISETIKLLCILERIDEAKKLYQEKNKLLIQRDIQLKNCVKLFR